MIFAHTVPTQSQLADVFGILPNQREHKILVGIPEYNATDEFPEDTKPAEIKTALQKKFPPEKIAVIRPWKDVDAASRGLTSSNGQILKARAMQYLEVNPDSSVESYEWSNRFELALRGFSVCTKAERIWRSLGFGVLAFVISIPLSWLALPALSWVWCFLADWLGEVSRVIHLKPHRKEAEASGRKLPWMQHGVLASMCLLVIGGYAYVVQPGALELGSSNAADAYYNLLVQGFRAGQLSVKKDVPPGLAKLANPYNLSTYVRPSGLLDLSYYKGRLYLYFGVTPALILFWPYSALTGHYLFHRQAVVIFCALGFLAGAGLLRALWRRYFTDVSLGVVVACVVALGLATGVPVLLSQSDLWEVPISCGYMLTMLALGAIWCASHEPERRCRWLVAASAAYGLAVGARPSLLPGAIILLAPVVQARREGRRMIAPLLGAIIPIVLIGLGLMLYNARRFDNPFEFGLNYQLQPERQMARRLFGLHHFGFNFRAYFLQPMRWTARSPFVQEITMPPAPLDHANVQRPFGVLTNIPLVWLALAAPLAWRGRSEQTGGILRRFVTAVALLFGIEALTLGFYYCTASRFEVEFLPELVLLAVVGILGLKRALAPTSESGLVDRPVRRRAVRWAWGLLLSFSVAFNLLAGVEYHAEEQTGLGDQLFRRGEVSEAIGRYQQALRINPDYAKAHESLGSALVKLGRLPEAIVQYQQALLLNPDYAEAHNNLGIALAQVGRLPEAIAHFEQALRISPDHAEAHSNLGAALARTGKIEEAVAQYEQALRIKPDFAEAHYNLGNTLAQAGRLPEAIAHFEQALRINPDHADAHSNLGVALAQTGRIPEAIEHLRQALRIKPDFAQAQSALAQLQAGQ
ncbi:MAG: tetratricopeptide repeat protein [Verrucomicrobiia bacterium]